VTPPGLSFKRFFSGVKTYRAHKTPAAAFRIAGLPVCRARRATHGSRQHSPRAPDRTGGTYAHDLENRPPAPSPTICILEHWALQAAYFFRDYLACIATVEGALQRRAGHELCQISLKEFGQMIPKAPKEIPMIRAYQLLQFALL
jgi:hypothetical protein